MSFFSVFPTHAALKSTKLDILPNSRPVALSNGNFVISSKVDARHCLLNFFKKEKLLKKVEYICDTQNQKRNPEEIQILSGNGTFLVVRPLWKSKTLSYLFRNDGTLLQNHLPKIRDVSPLTLERTVLPFDGGYYFLSSKNLVLINNKGESLSKIELPDEPSLSKRLMTIWNSSLLLVDLTKDQTKQSIVLFREIELNLSKIRNHQSCIIREVDGLNKLQVIASPNSSRSSHLYFQTISSKKHWESKLIRYTPQKDKLCTLRMKSVDEQISFFPKRGMVYGSVSTGVRKLSPNLYFSLFTKFQKIAFYKVGLFGGLNYRIEDGGVDLPSWSYNDELSFDRDIVVFKNMIFIISPNADQAVLWDLASDKRERPESIKSRIFFRKPRPFNAYMTKRYVVSSSENVLAVIDKKEVYSFSETKESSPSE